MTNIDRFLRGDKIIAQMLRLGYICATLFLRNDFRG